jgi:DNA polymerase III alpha subunit
MRIDLHTHSTASDGTDSPAELVVAARAAGLDVVALTDHDTTLGWAPAAAALPEGLTLVRGWSCPAAGTRPTAAGRPSCTCSATWSIRRIRSWPRRWTGCAPAGSTGPGG